MGSEDPEQHLHTMLQLLCSRETFAYATMNLATHRRNQPLCHSIRGRVLWMEHLCTEKQTAGSADEAPQTGKHLLDGKRDRFR